MWSVRAHGGNPAERADRRPQAKTDRKGPRPGTAAAVSAALREGPGRGVDQVEGNELNLGQIDALRPLGPVFPLSDSSDSKPNEAGRVSSRSCLTRAEYTGRRGPWRSYGISRSSH